MRFIKYFSFVVIILIFAISCSKDNKSINNHEVLKFSKKIEDESVSNIEAEKYTDDFLQLLKSFKNDSVKRHYCFQIADKYYNLNNGKKYLEASKNILSLSLAAKDTSHIAKSLRYIADYYASQSIQDSALLYYIKSEKMYKTLNDDINLGKVKLYKATVFYYVGSSDQAEIEGIDALKILKNTKNSQLIYECNVLIGLCEIDLVDYTKAIAYFNHALKNLGDLKKYGLSKIQLNSLKSVCYNNIGNAYLQQKKYVQALQYYKKGLENDYLKEDRPSLYAMLLNNYAYAKMKNLDFKEVKSMLFKSLKIRDSLKLFSGIAPCKINIGEYFITQHDTLNAILYLKDGLSLSKKIKSNTDIVHALKLLSSIDIKNSKVYSELYFKAEDSIKIEEKRTRRKFALIAFETDEITKKNKDLNQKVFYLSLLAISLLTVVISIFYIFKLRLKNKEFKAERLQQKSDEKIYNLIIEQQIQTEKAKEKVRNQIAMELHDGIINNIFTIRFNLEQLESSDYERKEKLVGKLKSTEEEIRNVSHDLNKKLDFSDNSLPEIITLLIEENKKVGNTEFELAIDKYIDWSKVSSKYQINIYRIIQEAIQNVNKYANATKCKIIILKTKDNITIQIWDNGVGFNVNQNRKGIGLENIKKRCSEMNAIIEITSNIGEGTFIKIVL